MQGTVKTAKNLLYLSGERANKRAPAPCALCGIVFRLLPTQDIPKHRCAKSQEVKHED